MVCIGCCHLHQDSTPESVKFRSALDKTVGGLLPSSVHIFALLTNFQYFIIYFTFLFYASEFNVFIVFCSFYDQVKDQLSLLARRFRQTADEKSIEGAQNMLLDSLNCIVLASASDDEPNQSDMNSRRNISSSMAGSDKSVLRSHGNVLRSEYLNF